MAQHFERAYPRNPFEAPLQYHVPCSGQCAKTKFYNLSEGGLYFETFHPMAPDEKIEVVMSNKFGGAYGPEAYSAYLARIRWCRKLRERERLRYGVGIEFLEKRQLEFNSNVLETEHFCDMCGASIATEAVCQTDGTGCLCIKCADHLETVPSGTLKACILQFLDGNVL